MVMNARTHTRGAAPDFALTKPNPNPSRMTDALWWLVCQRELLEPELTDNGGTYADKPGYHNAGENLPDHGEGNLRTDHSIRREPDRVGPWWRTKASAHDWTFRDAQRGDYHTITLYTRRLIHAMEDVNDPRPDYVYAYTLGQVDGDVVVEGYNEYKDLPETSGDKTHLWHRHDSLRRNIIGSFPHMWKALTIDMGWSVEDWLKSIGLGTPNPGGGGGGIGGWKYVEVQGNLPVLKLGNDEADVPGDTQYVKRAQAMLAYLGNYDGPLDGIYGPGMQAAVRRMMADDRTRSSSSGSVFGLPEWRRAYGLWG